MNIQVILLLTTLANVIILMAMMRNFGASNHIISIIGVFVIIGLNFFNVQIILKRIRELHSVIKAVSKGNMEKRTRIEAKDEIGQLANDLNVMIESMVEAKRLPENILRSMKDGLFVVDTKGNISDVNQALIDMLGYSKEELIGKPISFVFVKRTNQ